MGEVKTCSTCLQTKCLSEFPPRKHGRICKPCKNLKQKQYRQENDNLCTKVYEKTVKGYIMRTYRNMLSRVTGVQKQKAHLYKGKPILAKDEFYHWSLTDADFLRLFRDWEASGYEHKLSPSIDRIDSDDGYCLGNIRWITQSMNSALGALSKRLKKETNYE